FSLPYGTGTGQGRVVVPTGLRWLRVKRFKPDIIHTQLFFALGLEALIASKILKVPIVGTNHTAVQEFVRYSPIRSRTIENLLIRYVSWFYEKCTLVTMPSKSVINEMRQFGFSGECRIISNPIDTKTFSPSSRKTNLKNKLGFSKFTVIHAGRLARERKIDVIIKAIAASKQIIPEIELIIAGGGSYEKELRFLARSLGVENSIKFLGVLSKPALAEAYNASEIFAITSTADTQSLVMMQAMACGIPVIGVNARALPEYIRPENGILIEPGDVKALTEKIIFLHKHKNIQKKLGDGARAYSIRFSAPEIAQQWEKIYEKVIEDYNK
ncbi:MAG: glycosyltransferase, partial [Patescibacteria group bacterium]